MKTSRVILLSMAGAAALIIIAFAIIIRTFFVSGEHLDGDLARLKASDTYITNSYEITGFQGIRSTGNWKITISDSAESVIVEYPENIEEHLIVERKGTFLILSLESDVRISGLDQLEATIPSNEISEIESSGVLDLDLGDLDFEDLLIRTSGGSNIDSDGGTIAALTLHTSGAANVDLERTRVDDAEVHSSGAGRIALRMDGGNLTGTLSGAVVLTYRGDADDVDVRTSGVSSVNYQSR
jgi:hypothetical protein